MVIIHVLGDGISLPLVGAISTQLAQTQAALPGMVMSSGQFFNLNPQTQTLSMALLLMPVAMLGSGAQYALGLTTPEGKETSRSGNVLRKDVPRGCRSWCWTGPSGRGMVILGKLS